VVGVARNQKIFQMPCDELNSEFQYDYQFRLFQRFIHHINPRMLSAATGQIRPIIQQTCAYLMRSQMPLGKREAVNVFEAMKMESAFIDWLKENEAVYHNNYRVLFDEGALEPLMQFLARTTLFPQSMTWPALLAQIPIEMLRSWRKGLLKDPSHRPYS
jgi:hypothetical protein